ncbi:hypothetical protein COLO4_33333 [Corchorus olitorius]|uniref:RRM domain-containing protein n=1 Tax=Corchorus olitorius TaxID=93759 RepID=A0A1R3GUQ2_9ROSI|nr:hypothetical protein COLO4_33333 [Corchorus olitorius]
MVMDDKSIGNFSQSFVLAPLNKPRSYFILNDVLRFHDEEPDLPKETIVAVEPSLGKSDYFDDDTCILAAPSERSFLNIANALNESDAPFNAAPVRKFIEKNESQIDQGKSIHVANLAVDVKPEALREVFKNFGTIRSNGIKIRPNFGSNRCFVFIEFEFSISTQSAIHTQSAIQAFPIIIGTRKAYIEKKKSNSNTKILMFLVFCY